MPAKSLKQLRFMNAAAARGEIPQKTVDEMNQASKGMNLPERAPKKPPPQMGKMGKMPAMPKQPKMAKAGSTDDLRALYKKKFGKK